MAGTSVALPSLPDAPGTPPREASRSSRVIGTVVVILALLSAVATFVVLAGLVPLSPTHDVVLRLFMVNALLVMVLLGFVVREAYRLIKARRAGVAASGLHAKIVALFALVAALPAILVAVVGWITLERGLDIQFSRYIRSLLSTSVDVANAYRELQCRTIGREINLMAADLARAKPLLDQNRPAYRDFMQSRSVFLGFPVAMLLKDDLSVVERIEIKPIEGLPLPSKDDMAAAQDSEAWCLIPNSGNVFRAVLKVPAMDQTFLFVARAVDPKALEFPQQAEQAAAYYEALSQRKIDVQVAFASMYVLISLILLFSAVWTGLAFANSFVSPIRRLIHATDQVASGNFYVQVPARKSEGDLAHLAETFNKMTSELRQQHDRLTQARDLIDRRRRFTEAVLSGVSAGVISIDAVGRITVLNPSAERLLHGSRDKWLGKPVQDMIPALAPIVDEALSERLRLVQGQVVVSANGQDRTLTVRVSSEQSPDGDKGWIITLDDITDLVSAQRTAAWADVARRIAHEIKNPLTPIQLSAERIKRKYGKVITVDREIFDQCTDTIVRQVDDIKRMVDEFSSFARMPKPLAENEDLGGIVRQVLFLMRVGSPDITFEEDIPPTPLVARFDRRLISQAVTNIVKNATEAIAASPEEVRGPGLVKVVVKAEDDNVVITVAENGKGFPREHRQRLLEPYMTTRDGGTGLGLAIVAKILEDHGGGIELLDNPDVPQGGLVRMWFPREGVSKDTAQLAESRRDLAAAREKAR
ncbi:PAS domain-containing sensor histidine kinase [Alsobacter metallidurans]|uniref:histidine kinase n=1 Tax=Alsobacter metallidurans TaxID=340221 RepID=A0A917I604_9HYPH|nr:PAS domain-containing sensor histidine kinase [Alsobacter metallidurans]GGH18205.1 PAS domain-containing sensor histidine kinase [Alsobacter metallidurans]